MRPAPDPHDRPTRRPLVAWLIAVSAGAPIAHAQRHQPADPQAKPNSETPAVVTTGVQADLDDAARLLQADRPRDALQRLRSVEAAEPQNPWLWFYNGLAHFRLGNPYDAMDAFDRARDLLTAYGDPDPLLAGGIRQYRRKARSQVFSLSLNIGVAYDSNVTFLGSGGAGLDIAGRGDGKFASRFQFIFAPIADERETLSLGVRIADAWHFSIEQFNDQDYGATLRYVRSLGDHWSAAVQYDYDIAYLGNQPFSSIHAVTPSLVYKWTASASRFQPAETTLYYRIEARDFLFDTEPEFDRDGFTNAVALEQSFTLRPLAGKDWRWNLTAGYALESVATEGREFDRLDHTFYLALAFPLTNPFLPDKDLEFHFNANWQIADYRNDSLIDADEDERSDFITALNVVLSQKLVEDPRRGDVTIHGLVGWTDADSNVTLAEGGSPFTYDKWVAGVQLEWSW